MNKKNILFTSFRTKVIIIFFVVMMFCACIWTAVMFLNMQDSAVDNMLRDEQQYIDKTTQIVHSVEEVCNMTINIIPQMEKIFNYFELVQSGEDFDKQQKIEFYNNDIETINNIINLNPYLYQIRMYVNSDNITEQKPCIYNKERLSNLEWAENRQDGSWNVDYSDNVFPNNPGNEKLAGITTTVNNSLGEELCVIEVATKMSSLFPDIYNTNKNEWACFIDNYGNIHYDNHSIYTPENLDEIKQIVYKTNDEVGVYSATIDNDAVVISVNKINSLGGTYVHYTKVNDTVHTYFLNQRGYFVIVILTLAISLLLVSILTTFIFKRFSMLSYYINKIQEGHTDLRLDTDGGDEIAEVATQINGMLDKLEVLNEENTNRQLLIKNTEIKSLQNQINAHFMYNVLESIKMMAEIEGQYNISDAITSLGQMFRYSVKWNSGKAELRDEIDYIKNYLSLMNIRLENEVYLSINVPDDIMGTKIPKMSLQPIIENSILHGIEGAGKTASIYLKAYVEGDVLNIDVSDNGMGMSEELLKQIQNRLNGEIERDEAQTHGLALKNVQDRIKMYYGDEYGLEIYSQKGLYTKVAIKIPYEKRSFKNG